MPGSRSPSIIAYLVVTFAWSWLFWGPAALHFSGALSLPDGLVDFLQSPNNPAAWGPLVGALVAALLAGGLGGVWNLLKRGLALNFGLVWFLVIFATFPLLIGGSLLIAVLTGDPAPEMPALAEPAVLPIAFIFILLFSGPLQEEFGWRGILQDRLQEKWGASLAAIGVGIIWGLWHFPLFYLPGHGFYYDRPIWGLVLSTTLISVLFAWIFNNTGKSLAAMLLFHAMYNFTHYLFPTLQSDKAALILFGLEIVVALGVVAICGPARLNGRARKPDTAPR